MEATYGKINTLTAISRNLAIRRNKTSACLVAGEGLNRVCSLYFIGILSIICLRGGGDWLADRGI